jgi:hypothetical protein
MPQCAITWPSSTWPLPTITRFQIGCATSLPLHCWNLFSSVEGIYCSGSQNEDRIRNTYVGSSGHGCHVRFLVDQSRKGSFSSIRNPKRRRATLRSSQQIYHSCWRQVFAKRPRRGGSGSDGLSRNANGFRDSSPAHTFKHRRPSGARITTLKPSFRVKESILSAHITNPIQRVSDMQ